MAKRIIKSRAPVRISFAGGGTDVSPFTEKYGGAVVNVPINKYAFASLKFRNDQKIIIKSDESTQEIIYPSKHKIKYDGKLDISKAVIKHYSHTLKTGLEIYSLCDAPPRSGLGASASVFAATIEVFNGLHREKRMDKYDVAELAYRLEREELKNLGGRQDQYATVFGGLNFIEFKGNDFVRVNPLRLSRNVLLELETNLLLLYVGARQDSGDIIESQVKNIQKKRKSLEAMKKTKKLAVKVKYALLRGDLNLFGNLLHQGWMLKKQFTSKITTPFINELYKNLRRAGAMGGKITGAGGGGHMIFYCTPGKKQKVIEKAIQVGVDIVPLNFDFNGLVSWEASE